MRRRFPRERPAAELRWSSEGRPGESDRHARVVRLLDLLSAVPERRRLPALRSLNLQLDRPTERLTLGLVALWSAAQLAGEVPVDGRDAGRPET